MFVEKKRKKSIMMMDYDRTSFEWVDHDFDNFEYGFKGESTVVTNVLGPEAR